MSMPKIPSALDHPYLEDAVRAAAKAGETLMKFFRRDMRVTEKGQANFVSEADLESERVLHEMLLEAVPSADFMSEESFASSSLAKQLWITDPLDGTTNFLHHVPQFAISIAYRNDDVTELGVIHNPANNSWYYGVAGRGAYFDHRKMRVCADQSITDALVCFGFFYDRDQAMSATMRCLDSLMRRNIHGIRRFGAAALDLAAVADGSYGAFFEFELQPWDMAAGNLMVAEAGGLVTDCVGDPISCHVPSSILATNGIIHREMLPIVQEHFQSY
jgi:myo-inositol-1(or 4)-monophosphatase